MLVGLRIETRLAVDARFSVRPWMDVAPKQHLAATRRDDLGVGAQSDPWDEAERIADDNCLGQRRVCIGVRNAVLVHNVCGPDLDALSASGQREISPQGITKAGASIEQHQAELGINVTGGTAAKNALGQFLLDDILTNPGTIHLPVTSGRFAGGLYFISPTGVGAAFDANRVFQYFGIFSR
jgi:hypothetical protein